MKEPAPVTKWQESKELEEQEHQKGLSLYFDVSLLICVLQ